MHRGNPFFTSFSSCASISGVMTLRNPNFRYKLIARLDLSKAKSLTKDAPCLIATSQAIFVNFSPIPRPRYRQPTSSPESHHPLCGDELFSGSFFKVTVPITLSFLLATRQYPESWELLRHSPKRLSRISEFWVLIIAVRMGEKKGIVSDGN